MAKKVEKPAETPKRKRKVTIPKYRQCKLCWGTRKGVGRANGREGEKVYFKCIVHLDEEGHTQPGGCGFTWPAWIRRVEVQDGKHTEFVSVSQAEIEELRGEMRAAEAARERR